MNYYTSSLSTDSHVLWRRFILVPFSSASILFIQGTHLKFQRAMEQAARWYPAASEEDHANYQNEDYEYNDAVEVTRRMRMSTDISIVPSYLIEFNSQQSRPVGSGGEGMVYRGRFAGKDVAIKLIFGQLQALDDDDSAFNVRIVDKR